MDILKFHQIVFTFFGTFENESNSKTKQLFMKVYSIAYQIIFIILGFVLFSLSILESPSSKQTLQILFVVFAYLNAAFKALTFFMKRKQLQSLWMQLDDPNFTAKNPIEKQ